MLQLLKTHSSKNNPLPTGSHIDGIAFSDSFVRVVTQGKAPSIRFLALSELVSLRELQRKIIQEFGLLVRGAVALGEIFIKDSIVFGPALLRAVELEKNATKRMPLILLDHSVSQASNGSYKSAEENFEKFVSQYQSNDMYPVDFLNYFCVKHQIMFIGGKRDLSFLMGHKNFIIKNAMLCKDNIDILKKYRWLAAYHNQEIETINKYVNLKEGIDIPSLLITNRDMPSDDNMLGFKPFPA